MPEPSDGRCDPRSWQTLLFVPADKRDMLCKAQRYGADAVLVDLEDAVAPQGKAAARTLLTALLGDGALDGPSAICVRVNAVGEGVEEDLAAIAGAHVAAIVLPKVSDAAAVTHARAAINERLEGGESVGLVPQVESVLGILELGRLTGVGGVDALAFGGEDFCVDLGVARSEDALELLVPRALLALQARAADLPAIDTVYTAIHDEQGLLREATTARQLGFTGKLLIHPSQIQPVRRVFAPTDEELVWARRVLETQGSADGSEAGVGVVDGRMVDAPVIGQAERLLARERR